MKKETPEIASRTFWVCPHDECPVKLIDVTARGSMDEWLNYNDLECILCGGRLVLNDEVY